MWLLESSCRITVALSPRCGEWWQMGPGSVWMRRVPVLKASRLQDVSLHDKGGVALSDRCTL